MLQNVYCVVSLEDSILKGFMYIYIVGHIRERPAPVDLWVSALGKNEMKWIGFQATSVHIQAKLGQEDGEMSEMTLPSRNINLKLKSWRSAAEHVTSRSRRLPTILSFMSGWGRNIFVSFKPPRPGNEPRALAWHAAVLLALPRATAQCAR